MSMYFVQIAAPPFILIVFIVSIIIFGVSALFAGRRPALRPLPGFKSLPGQLSQVIEEGQSLPLSLGSGGVGGSDTATTLAGLAVLEGLSEESAATDVPPTVTVADPTILVMAQDVLRRAYAQQGNAAGLDFRSVRYVAASPLPYAAGVMDLLSNEETSTSVMAGVFGPESAFIAEEGSRQGLIQVAGVADLTSQAVLYPSVNHLAIGEEMYAAGAYLSAKPASVGSLLAQDIIRLILIIGIGVGGGIQLIRSLGMLLGGAPR